MSLQSKLFDEFITLAQLSKSFLQIKTKNHLIIHRNIVYIFSCYLIILPRSRTEIRLINGDWLNPDILFHCRQRIELKIHNSWTIQRSWWTSKILLIVTLFLNVFDWRYYHPQINRSRVWLKSDADEKKCTFKLIKDRTGNNFA